jgi:glycosyltransferase involved in cell wall biosynthesis
VRVAYELTGLELDGGGSARAARGLRAALEARSDVELLPIAQPGARGGGGARGSRVVRGLARELTWFPVRLPRRVARLGADILHCPFPLAPPARHATPTVVAVGDALAWEHPEWFTRANRTHAHTVLTRALRRASAVVVPSKHTRERLRHFTGVDATVTPWGIGEQFTPGEEAAGDYLLAVGTLQPRKNLEAAFAAFERLERTDLRLVVAGARGWRDEAVVARARRSPAAARIELAGRVTDDELIALYRGAACFVFPSRGEGFGFPPLEAMACGTPVVAASSGSLPEVLGDAAALVDPDDVYGLAQAVERVLADPEPWRARGLARAAGFSWARCAEETVAVYRSATA